MWESVSAQRFSQYITLQWRYNERDGVSNHQRLDNLLNRGSEARINESIKVPCHRPLYGEITGPRQ